MIVVWTETALEHLAGIKHYISQTSQRRSQSVTTQPPPHRGNANAPGSAATAAAATIPTT